MLEVDKSTSDEGLYLGVDDCWYTWGEIYKINLN